MGRSGFVKFVGMFLLSVVITEIITTLDSLRRGSFFAGESGLPLKYSSASLFGGGSLNYINFLLDIIFWLVVIIIFWKILTKLTSKK